MAINMKKTPAWVPGQGISLTGTGPGMTASTSGGGGGGGASRPLVDGNHIHVWNFNEAGGATQIVDSVGGKNLTLHGTEGTDYALYQSKSGANPWFEIKQDGASMTIADNTTMSLPNLAEMTLECVMYLDALPNTDDHHSILWLTGASDREAYLSLYNYPSGTPGMLNGGTRAGDTGYPWYGWYYSVLNGTPCQAPTGQPFHVMFIMDTPEWVMGYGMVSPHRVYVNGSLVADSYVNGMGSPRSTIDGLTNMYFGGAPTRKTPKCFVRDVRISNIARDASYGIAAAAALTT